MNRLFYNRVYLSGPIDNASDFGVGWRQMVQENLADMDLIFLDPCKSHYNQDLPAKTWKTTCAAVN